MYNEKAHARKPNSCSSLTTTWLCFNKLSWSTFLSKIVTVFTNSQIQATKFIRSLHRIEDNCFNAEKFSTDTAKLQHVHQMAKARKVVLEGMFKSPASNDRNDRYTTN